MDFKKLCKKIKPFHPQIVGKSVMQQPIYSFHIGSAFGKQYLIESGIHAREYISILIALKLAQYYSIKKIDFGIYFLPMTNPDGVRLSLDGCGFIKNKLLRNNLLLLNNNSYDFSLWKANANGVDLNTNHNALWGKGIRNVHSPSSANYIGPYPNSEPETIAITNYVRTINPDAVISLHSKGEVVYYGFDCTDDNLFAKELKLTRQIADTAGYKIEKLFGSTGGFSDWTSLHLRVPSVTVELGSDALSHPIEEEHSQAIFEKIKDILFNISLD